MEWLDEYEKLVIRMNTPRVVIDNAVCTTATLVQREEARRAAGGGAGARRPGPLHQEGLRLLRRLLVHGRLPRHGPPRPQAHRRQRHHLHPAVAGHVERAGATGRAGGAHGAGADRRRPHGPALRGLRRARRHAVQRRGGARVDAPRPPRLHRLPPRRGRRRRRRRQGAANPRPPRPPPTRGRRRRGRRPRRRRRARRPPPPPAHGRRPGPRPRVPHPGRVRRELGGARVLRGHRAVPRPTQAAVRRRLHAQRHGLRRLPRHRRHHRRPSAPGILHSARRWEPHPFRGREPESEPMPPSRYRTEITRGCETGAVHAGPARAAVRRHANVPGERVACSSGRGVDQGRRCLQRVLRDRRCRQCRRPERHRCRQGEGRHGLPCGEGGAPTAALPEGRTGRPGRRWRHGAGLPWQPCQEEPLQPWLDQVLLIRQKANIQEIKEGSSYTFGRTSFL